MTTAVDPLLLLADRLDSRPDPYAHDPVGWVRDRLGEFMWSAQREVLEAVRDHRYVAVHSAHDMGKSFSASRLAAWWLEVHPAGEAFVVSTAPTFPQVRAILWREIGRAHRKGRLRGRVNQTEWHIDGEIVGYGRKPSDYDPSAFQGIHARYVLVIIDEACGVPEQLWNAVDALVTNEDCRVLAIGNPDDPSSHFEKVCRPGSGWHVKHIDGLESPNFTGEHVPREVRHLLMSPTWVEERRARWGEGSPLWQAKVRGVFPEDTTDGVVPLSWVKACQRPVDRPAGVQLLPVELGVDVGGGGDESVIQERRGPVAGRVWRDRQPDTMRVVGLTVQAIRETQASRVKVDVVGIGWGVADRLLELRREGAHRAEIVRVNVGEASSDPARFPRLRDELWWMARELSETRGWDLSGVDDDTVAELIAPTYTLDSAGRVVVEKKDDTRQRLGRSPDNADALTLAFYSPPRRTLNVW